MSSERQERSAHTSRCMNSRRLWRNEAELASRRSTSPRISGSLYKVRTRPFGHSSRPVWFGGLTARGRATRRPRSHKGVMVSGVAPIALRVRSNIHRKTDVTGRDVSSFYGQRLSGAIGMRPCRLAGPRKPGGSRTRISPLRQRRSIH